jgi:hypothetical protein
MKIDLKCKVGTVRARTHQGQHNRNFKETSFLLKICDVSLTLWSCCSCQFLWYTLTLKVKTE